MKKRNRVQERSSVRLLSLASMLPREWPQDRFYLSRQIEAAINFAHTGQTHHLPSTADFGSSVQTLLDKMLRSHPQIGFFPWDAAEQGPWQPLFARAAILKGISRLRSYQRAVFLVENLAESIAPNGAYWTNRRDLEFTQARSYIEALIAEHTPKNALWRLLLT